MHLSSALRSVQILALGLLLNPNTCAGQPGEDLFQKGARLFQSGDMTQAVKMFIAAANAGNTKASVQVGWCYESGAGVPQSLPEAAKWYRRAAERGESRGQKNLGALYEEGRGV